MLCQNCGRILFPGDAVCPDCGVKAPEEESFGSLYPDAIETPREEDVPEPLEAPDPVVFVPEAPEKVTEPDVLFDLPSVSERPSAARGEIVFEEPKETPFVVEEESKHRRRPHDDLPKRPPNFSKHLLQLFGIILVAVIFFGLNRMGFIILMVFLFYVMPRIGKR